MFDNKDLLARNETSEDKESSQGESAQVEVLQLAEYDDLSSRSTTSLALESIQKKGGCFQ